MDEDRLDAILVVAYNSFILHLLSDKKLEQEPELEMHATTVRGFRKDLRVLEREIELTLASQTGCCSVTVAQCHLLLEVEQRGEAGVTELAAALELDKSTLSRSVDGLHRAGLLRRQTDPESRRQVVVSLTEQGKAKADAINTLCDGFYARILESIPAGRRREVMDSVALVGAAMRDVRRKGGNPCGD